MTQILAEKGRAEQAQERHEKVFIWIQQSNVLSQNLLYIHVEVAGFYEKKNCIF